MHLRVTVAKKETKRSVSRKFGSEVCAELGSAQSTSPANPVLARICSDAGLLPPWPMPGVGTVAIEAAIGGGYGWGWGLGLGVAAAALTAPYWAYRPYYYPYGYAPSYGYGYAPYYQPYGPVSYVDRTQMESRYRPQAAMPQRAHSYFYCRGTSSYYPYARQCAGGWEQISAKPAGL